MLFLEDLRPLRIYKRPLFLPTVKGNKKKKSAIFLLTPNYESSKATMMSPLFVNRLRFASYYIEKDITYMIKNKTMSEVEDVTETYVRDFSEFDFYQSLCEMKASERNALKDSTFGLPKKRKYPLNDADHVRSAIRFFNYVDKEDEAELAKNIKKAIKKFNVKVKVGKNNRFSNYYTSPVTESTDDVAIYEGKIIELGNGNYSYKFYDGDTEVCEVCIDYGDEKDSSNYIFDLKVNKNYQRQGIGTALIEYAVDTLGGDTLSVNKSNKVALHMYEEAGFEITGEDKDNRYIMSISEDKMYAKERNALKNSSFGLPSKRKYPLNDEDHVRAAIRFFNKVDKADEAELAKNIKKAIKKFGMKVNVGKDNRFSNYYTTPVTEDYIEEDKMYAKERNALKSTSFGIPSKRKFPLNDKDHVKAAIRFFNKVDKEDEETLARNLNKAINKFFSKDDKPKVGKNNRFSKYYTGPVAEEAELVEETTIYSNIDKDYKPKGKKDLSSYRKETITSTMVEKYKDLKHVRLDNETCAFFDGDNLVGYVAVEQKNDYYTWITALEVTKDYQGYGLGNQILKYAIDNMDANALSVNKNNKVAYEMYKKAGFYVFNDTDTMYFMTTDPVKAELNESTSYELDYIKGINEILNSYEYYIKGAKLGDLDIDDFNIKWRLQSPKEVDKNKFGICWDFACYEDYMLSAARIPHKNYYVLLPDTKYKDTHTFVVAKLNDGRYVYMESSIKNNGMQGIFITNNISDIFNHVVGFMVDHGNDKPATQKYLIYEYPDIKDYGCDAKTFEKYCTANKPIFEGIMRPGYHDTLTPISEEYTLTEAAIEDPMEFIVDLNKKLNKFEYGVKVNGKVTDKPEDLDKYYKTESPEEFEKNKCGICYDYALYQDTKLKEAGIPHDNYFVMIPENKRSNMTHTFTVAKVDGDYVYMESSFRKIGGVHIAKNLNDIFNYIISNMIGESKGEYEYFIVKTGKVKVGISIHDYIEEMYKKSTVKVSKYKGGKPTDKGIVTESTISTKKLYHVSPGSVKNITLKPEIPDNFMTKNRYEDYTTKRVCFSTSINGCLIGMSKNLEGQELYVYTPIEDCEVYEPTEKEVPDVKYTNEVWVKEQVRVKCIGKIIVGKAKDKPMTYTYGKDKTADLYDWNYTMVEKYDESIDEGYLMTESDIYYNMDEFNSGKINLCFVTGHMGSGKSTMAGGMAAQDPNIETYCIDDIEFNFCFSDNDLKRYGDLIYSFFQDDAGKPYRTWTNNMTGQMVWGQDMRTYSYVKDADTAFIKYAMKYAKTHRDKKYIIEGIEIFEFMEPEDFKNYAVCIKGTSAIKSAYRATKRDLSHAKDSQAKNDTLKKKLRELKPVFTVDEKDIKKFRKYFTKLNDRKKVNSGDYVYEAVIKDDPDIYYNKDKFDNGDINLCFITGMSGSGKTTMADKKKDDKTIVIGLDHALCNIFYTLDEYKESSAIEYAFYTDPKYNAKYYSDGSDTTKTINGKNFWDYWKDRDYDKEACNDFIDFAIKWAKTHKDQKFIIEGVQLYLFIDPEKLKDYAVYIKGTSALKSSFRAAKRDSTDYEHKGTIREKAKDIMQTGAQMIKNAKRTARGIAGIDKYRKYFEKLTSTNESYLGEDGFVKYTNTPDTAIVSCSAIITDDEGRILVEDHVKCGGLNLPGGKENPGESIEEALSRELNEELGIAVNKDDTKLLCVNTFKCEYPNGSESFSWFKDYCYYITHYEGEIENLEPDKHEDIKFMSLAEIQKLESDNEPISELLKCVLKYIKDYYYPEGELPQDKITVSGYVNDLELIRTIANVDFYKTLLEDIGFEDIDRIYVPKINIVSCDREHLEIGLQQNGEDVINIFIPTFGTDKCPYDAPQDYLSYLAFLMVAGIMECIYQKVPKPIIECFARYIVGISTDENEERFIDNTIGVESPAYILKAIDNGDITPNDFYTEAKKYGCNKRVFKTIDDVVQEKSSDTVENLTNKIKYRTKVKNKIAVNKIARKAEDATKKIQDDATPDPIPKKSENATPQIDTEGKGDVKDDSKDKEAAKEEPKKLEESLLEALANDEYMVYGDYVTFFTEDASNDTMLRRILWSERMVKRKEVVALLDRAKADIPFIKYAYPDLKRYLQRNMFVDLYYYNQAFFKNNNWNAYKSFNLYKDFLGRLLSDKRITDAGYERKTVFIPINDWHKNPSTQMWMFKQDLNPISVIYRLMMTNPGELKKLFKGMQVLFFSKDVYFTIDFNGTIDKKTANKFRTFIRKINKGEEFDAEDIDTTEDTPTKESIKTTIMDDIEDAKGVDLTSANNKVQAEKPGSAAAIVANAPKSVGVAIKKEPEEEEKKKETHTTSAPAKRKPAVKSTAISVATMSALDSKVKKAAEKQIAQQNDNVKEVEKTVSKSTANKPVTDDNIKTDEQIEKDIIKAIDKSVDQVYVTDVDDAYDAMDDDQTLKDLLISLDSMKDNSVNITQARADRMTELDKQLLDKSLRGRTIREILDKDSDPTKPVEIPTTDLPVASPNPEWKDVSYMNFDKTYDMEKDIVNAFEHFTTVSRPMAIRNISVQDNSTSEDYIDIYTCEYEDYKGKRFTIKLDIPKVIEDRFMIRGDKRMIQTQFFNMPIVKTADDVCQIVTNYKKIIISRYNTSSGKSMPYATRLIKAANKYTGRRIKFTPGDNTLICAKYNLPIDYIDLSSVFSKIETDVITIYFNQDEIRKAYEIDETKGVPFAINKERNEIIYYPDDETVPFSDIIINMICAKKDNGYDNDFYDLFCSMKEASKGTYTRAKIMGSEIPLVVVCAYHDGLTTVLKKANIEYEIVEKLNSEIRSDINKDTIRFKDGYLVYKIDYNSSLLLNGLKDCDCILHSIAEIDDKNMYLEFLDDFGGRIKADGLENFYDCEIDPISKETLAYYKLPTEYISVLLYANRLLSDNKFVKHTNVSSRRARRFELVAAYTYQVLAEAYSSYATSVKHNRNGAAFSCKQSAVIDKILQDPTSSDYSTINMLNDIESTNAITTKGLSGLNANRSYSLDKRTYDDSMLDVVGMSTGFSANVGITRQATMDMNIEGSRGYVKDINGNTADLNSAKTLTATEAVVPLCTTHDDPFRVAMTFIQSSKHAVRTEHSDPLLVTNGADEALPYMCSDEFAHKAKQEGTIKELNDDYMIVEYADGSKEYINLDETIQKNSDGGFYVPLKLDADPKLKVGSKVKPNQILAYDKTSLSNSAGEDDNLAYDVGTLAKVAIINMDEGFEDSGIVTEGLAKKLTARIIYKEDCILDKGTNVYNIAKVGQHVEQGDTLLMWQTPYDEEEVNNLLKALANDREALSELGRHTVKSEVTGTLVGIKMYRTVELDELSDSLKEALRNYEKPISELKKRLKEEDVDTSTLPADYPLKPTGKLKKAGNGVLIEFYVEYDDIVGVGDKITYNAANKAVIKSVIPEGKEPYTNFRPNEPISALVSSTSIAKRMVTSTRVYGYLQKLMIELDRSCKDLAGIPYDDSEV